MKRPTEDRRRVRLLASQWLLSAVILACGLTLLHGATIWQVGTPGADTLACGLALNLLYQALVFVIVLNERQGEFPFRQGTDVRARMSRLRRFWRSLGREAKRWLLTVALFVPLLPVIYLSRYSAPDMPGTELMSMVVMTSIFLIPCILLPVWLVPRE